MHGRAPSRLLFRGAVLLVALATPGCDGAKDPIAFENVTQAAGITYSGPSWGLAWGRFNGDDRPDLWSTNHGTPSLYVALDDGTFRETAAEAVHVPPADAHGVAWADVANDGTQALLETVGAERGEGRGGNRLYVQTGKGFDEQAIARGLDYPLARGRTPLWFDANADGRLDVLLTTAARPEAPTTLFEQRGDGTFGASQAGPTVTLDSSFAQLASLTPGRLHVLVHAFPYPGKVYQSDGPRFVEATGIEIPPTRFVSDVAIGDFIMPTVLGLAGVDAGAMSLRGVDLIARAHTREPLLAFSHSLAYGSEASCLQDARYKLVTYDRTRTGTTQFLFDKQDDPGETHSIFESQPALAARYQAARDALLASLVVRPGRPVEMDARLRRRLRALGYVQ